MAANGLPPASRKSHKKSFQGDYNMKTDKYGVQMEPDEEKVALVDMYDEQIFENEEYLIDNGTPLKITNQMKYATDYVQKLTLAEKWTFLNELLKNGQTEEILTEVLLDEIEAQGVLTVFDLEVSEA